MNHLNRSIKVISQRVVSAARFHGEVPNDTQPMHVAQNVMDSHADTSCAEANWSLLEYTGQVCEVSPFLSTYAPVKEVPIARCCTIWTSQITGHEYLLVADEMLWFGTTLQHSLLNPNQIRAYSHELNDNPWTRNDDFGIKCDDQFIPFDTTGMIVHFES